MKEKQERNFDKIKGIAFLKGRKIVITPKRDLIKNLDALPFPARNLIDMEKYLVPPGFIRGLFFKRIATIITSRGCPYRCTHCSIKELFGRTHRQRSVENVIKEIKKLKSEYNIQGVHFIDEDSLISRKWVEELCREIKQLRVYWSIETRVTAVDERLIKLMKKSGCLQLDFGIESGSDKILKILKKDLTVAQIKRACRLMKKTGMRFTASVLIGAPNETKDDLDKTYRLLKEIKPDFGFVNFITAIPGTELYEKYVKEEGKFDYSVVKSGLSYAYVPLTNMSEVSDKELIEYNKKFKKYFLNRTVASLFVLERLHFIADSLFFFLTNPLLVLSALNNVLFVKKERKTFKIPYDFFYEIQKGFYRKNLKRNKNG